MSADLDRPPIHGADFYDEKVNPEESVMSMSKKDYEIIASVIRFQVDESSASVQPPSLPAGNDVMVSEARVRLDALLALRTLRSLAISLCSQFSADDERFDHHQFLVACGVRPGTKADREAQT